ncbi:MAG: hypothetical protein ACREJD_03240 [Phycisphaerales bacterium]
MKALAQSLLTLFCAAAYAGPSIVGFNSTRAGAVAIDSGSIISQCRAAIVGAYPGVTLQGVGTLSNATLAGADVAFLSSATGGTTAIVPLTAAEQAALQQFVLAGNGVVIFTDNDTFAGGASAPANLSLLSVWALRTCTGTGLPWLRNAIVTSPHASPVTDGPFGKVTLQRARLRRSDDALRMSG